MGWVCNLLNLYPGVVAFWRRRGHMIPSQIPLLRPELSSPPIQSLGSCSPSAVAAFPLALIQADNLAIGYAALLRTYIKNHVN